MLEFINSTIAFPIRCPEYSASAIVFESLPNSSSTEHGVTSILYFLAENNIGRISPGYMVSAVYCSFSANVRFCSHVGNDVTLPSSQPAIIIICAAFLPFTVVVGFMRVPSLCSIASR